MSKIQRNIHFKFGSTTKYGLILLLIFALALFIRVYFRMGDVFGSGWVRLAETDPWYHLRLVENLLHHFPQNITFDPYTFFPFGRDVFFAPLFDLILGAVIWLIGLGSPSQHLIETVAAYFPAILGALVTIPVFFIGKELFNKKVGLVCAAAVAIMPGNFFARSLLGVTDHHIAEVLFSTTAALFLILAIKSARNNSTSFENIWKRDWKNFRLPLIYSLLFGLFLGTYMLCWVGGLLFVLIIFVFLIIQFILDHLTGKSTDYLCILGVPAFFIALLMILPFIGEGSLEKTHPLSLALGIVVFALLAFISRWMENRKMRRLYYLLVLVGIGAAGILILFFGAHSLITSALYYFKLFLPQGGFLTISEVQPLFYGFNFSAFTQSRPWGFFTTGFFFVPISICLLIYSSVKKANTERTFFLVWSLLMLLAMLGQNRFSYYFAVNVALFGGYITWKIFEWISSFMKLIGIEKRTSEVTLVSKNTRKGKTVKKAQKPEVAGCNPRPRYVSILLAGLVGFFLLFYPNLIQARDITRYVPAPDDDWHAALIWMKANTPEPFANEDFYYQLYKRPLPGKTFDYPESAYGVMSWWDYGHWITAIAQRIPNSNAFQDGAASAGSFFTSQDESSANKQLDNLRSKYIIIDKSMATNKFGAMVNWAGIKPVTEYYYQKNAAGKYDPLLVYYPEYYRSICSRLYNFGGNAVAPFSNTRVISFNEKTDSNGIKYKEIISNKTYSTFEEAEAIVKKSPGYRIVGTDPFRCPVPLEKLEHYRLIYQSPSIMGQEGDRTVTNVEIFEYKP
jgi:dolichyl-phosphooligosaccharide-protein glycotransferase